MLNDIARMVICRAYQHLHTHFHKVKSHAAVEGNEEVDAAAKAAAQLSAHWARFETLADYSGLYTDIAEFWVEKGYSTTGRCTCLRTELLRNPRKDIRHHMDEPHHEVILRIFPPTTIYARSLVAELAIVSVKHRDHAWSALTTDAHKRTLICIITGQLLTFKLISRYTKGQVAPLCPLCHAPGSTSQIVGGGCDEPSMKSGVINRHDNAVRIALSAIRKGPVGASAIVADVTPRDDDVSDPVEDDVPRRLPVHLLTQPRRRVRRALSAVTHLAAHHR